MIIVADNLHVVNSKIAKALAGLNPEPIIDLVMDCQKAGAKAIDINSGPLPKSPEKYFSFMVDTVQDVCDLPLVLDTANPLAVAAGLKVCHKRPIINGFSLEPSKMRKNRQKTIHPVFVAVQYRPFETLSSFHPK